MRREWNGEIMNYQVISEEILNKGRILFTGTLAECYEFRKKYTGANYPSLSIIKEC